MAYIPEYKNIFRTVLDIADSGKRTRKDIINTVAASFGFCERELRDRSIGSSCVAFRSNVGEVLSDMLAKGLLGEDEQGLIFRVEEKVIAIRMEECEHAILSLVKASPKTKQEIKDSLVEYFGTDTTPTAKDDNRLYTYMGQILKRLSAEGILDFDGSVYSAAPEMSVYIKDRTEVLKFKSAFLGKIHSKGGEFFEYYFMNLLSRYFVKCGKTVTEGYVTGGSDDGGIDCVIKTVDSLGFRETVMVQTKNRTDLANETDVRGFYGAVCARQGTRGIYAIISDFHPMAAKFLNSIDNCVGVNGDKIFAMAYDTSYGIIHENGRMKIDTNII